MIVLNDKLAMVSGIRMRRVATLLAACALCATAGFGGLHAQSEEPMAHIGYAQFKIPFSVDSAGAEPSQVQLWVSLDAGATWQIQGTVPSDSKQFDFRAASEGLYLFKVHIVDASGASFPSPSPPLRVLVDTSKPQAAVRADIDASGQLVIEARVLDQNLEPNSPRLRIRSNQDPRWRELPISLTEADQDIYHGETIADVPACREIAIVFTANDLSGNEGEATYTLSMPRTAAGDREMTLASTHQNGSAPSTTLAPGAHPLPGATAWYPDAVPATSRSVRPEPQRAGPQSAGRAATASPGKLVTKGGYQLSPPIDEATTEELPLPAPLETDQPLELAPTTETETYVSTGELQLEPEPAAASPDKASPEPAAADPAESRGPVAADSLADSPTIGRAFHCSSRAFSLDYSVEAAGGGALAEVELWGTEDGGRSWQPWGADPDRQSPFDVQVGNDGLFGFRMVTVGANGLVSARPRSGDSADVWINVDTNLPVVRITRAVYGEGAESGMLVVDYTCQDGHLVERPITLSYSERADGPWTTIATGLANTGIYLWKIDPRLPEKAYLKLECIDKAGNVGEHRLDLPIDIKGLAPRGFIQGFRPIEAPDR